MALNPGATPWEIYLAPAEASLRARQKRNQKAYFSGIKSPARIISFLCRKEFFL